MYAPTNNPESKPGHDTKDAAAIHADMKNVIGATDPMVGVDEVTVPTASMANGESGTTVPVVRVDATTVQTALVAEVYEIRGEDGFDSSCEVFGTDGEDGTNPPSDVYGYPDELGDDTSSDVFGNHDEYGDDSYSEMKTVPPVLTAGSLDALMQDTCLLYTSPSPRDLSTSRMPSSA